MKIMDLLGKESIVLNLKARDKESAIAEMAGILVKLHKLKSAGEIIPGAFNRVVRKDQ